MVNGCIIISNYVVIEIIFQGIMKLSKDVCKDILCSDSYILGNIRVNIFHLAGRYGFPLQVYTCISTIICKYILGRFEIIKSTYINRSCKIARVVVIILINVHCENGRTTSTMFYR